MVLFLLVGTYSLVPRTFSVSATPNLTATGFAPPTIDGVIGVGEWAHASRFNFSTPNFVGTFYMMNNDTDMFLAVRVTRSGIPGVSVPLNDLIVDITFDNTNAGTFHNNMDDIEFCPPDYCDPGSGTQGLDFNLISMGNDCCWGYTDTMLGGTNDVLAAATSNYTYDYVEFLHPLCSGDINDFCLHPGSVVGFMVDIVDTRGLTGVWPSGLPIHWAHFEAAWRECFYLGTGPNFHRDLSDCLS